MQQKVAGLVELLGRYPANAYATALLGLLTDRSLAPFVFGFLVFVSMPSFLNGMAIAGSALGKTYKEWLDLPRFTLLRVFEFLDVLRNTGSSRGAAGDIGERQAIRESPLEPIPPRRAEATETSMEAKRG